VLSERGIYVLNPVLFLFPLSGAAAHEAECGFPLVARWTASSYF
jgi:hypothetical protein